MSSWGSHTCGVGTAALASACRVHACTRRTCSTSSVPASPAARPSRPRSLRVQVPPLLHHPVDAAACPGRARRLIAQTPASARPLDLAALEADLLADDDTDTTLVIGRWHYLGTGWSTDGDTALATAAAARAREYAQWRAQFRRSQTTDFRKD